MKVSIIAIVLFTLLITAGCEKTPEPETKTRPYGPPDTKEILVQNHQFINGGGYRKQRIMLKKGIAAFEYAYNHADTLKISILDSNEVLIGSVINKGGQLTEGLDRINIPEDGKYILEVKATGRWQINVW
jgi:hypothetical protein